MAGIFFGKNLPVVLAVVLVSGGTALFPHTSTIYLRRFSSVGSAAHAAELFTDFDQKLIGVGSVPAFKLSVKQLIVSLVKAGNPSCQGHDNDSGGGDFAPKPGW